MPRAPKSNRASSCIYVACPACGDPIRILLATGRLADLISGASYTPEQLPRDDEGDRVLLCLACAKDAGELESAGLRFALGLLAEAIERISDEIRSTNSEDWCPPENVTAHEIEAFREMKRARLIKHYAAAANEDGALRKGAERARRAAQIGLHLVQTHDDDDDDEVLH